MKPTMTPCLWFDNNAEDAMNFYRSVFSDFEVISVIPRPAAAPGGPGGILAMTVRMNGQEIFALNGGPNYALTPAISMFLTCETQAEVDRYWDALSAGGSVQQCGWLTDRYGLSWQVVPAGVTEMLRDPDGEKANRVITAVMSMVKLDLARLKQAYAGEV